MTEAVVYGLAYAAFVLLSLAVDRHHRELFGSKATPPQRMTLRVAASVCLALSFIVSLRSRGAGIGTFVWMCAMCVTATTHTLLLPYLSRYMKKTSSTLQL